MLRGDVKFHFLIFSSISGYEGNENLIIEDNTFWNRNFGPEGGSVRMMDSIPRPNWITIVRKLGNQSSKAKDLTE